MKSKFLNSNKIVIQRKKLDGIVKNINAFSKDNKLNIKINGV